jgi:hypothetical protein
MLEKKKPASTSAATHDDDKSLRANLLAALDAEVQEESE